MRDLPVAEALPTLLAALRARPNAVLVAPPGAGKTTLVPLALLEAGYSKFCCWNRVGWRRGRRRNAWR